MTVQNTTSQIDINSNRGYTPKFRKHIHIKIGPFQEGFLGTTILSFITDIYTHKQINQWNNTKMGKNTTFHINVIGKPGYSAKYPEHVFSVIGLSLCRHGFDHKLRQITNCDGSVAIYDCRNFWRFKTQLLRLICHMVCHMISHMMWCDVIWYMISYDVWYHIIWYHMIWCYIIWYHMISFDMMLYHMLSYDII